MRRLGKYVAIKLVRLLQGVAFSDVPLYSLVDPFGFTAGSVPKGTIPLQDPIRPRQVATRSAARQKFGVSDHAVVIGLLGAIGPRKNPGVIAAACARIFSTTPGKLLMVGTIAADVKDQIHAAGLDQDQLILQRRLCI